MFSHDQLTKTKWTQLRTLDFREDNGENKANLTKKQYVLFKQC